MDFKQATVGQSLIEDGIAMTLVQTFTHIGYNPNSKLRILIDCLKYLTKSKICCIKLLEAGIVQLLIKIFANFKQFNGNVMVFKINSCTLITLQHLTKIKMGREFIRSENGLQLLYSFCINCPDKIIYNQLLLRICRIINECLERNELSAPEISPIRFRLPVQVPMKLKNILNISNINITENKIVSKSRFNTNFNQEAVNESYNFRDNLTKTKGTNSKITDDDVFSEVIKYQKPEEDNCRYKILFREFHNLHLEKLKIKYQSLEEEDLTLYSNFYILKSNSNYLRNISIQQNILEDNIYCSIANTVKSIIPFFKIAYPDITCTQTSNEIEPLNIKNRRVCRKKLLACMSRAVQSNNQLQEIVYDLDALIKNLSTCSRSEKILKNCDEAKVNKQFKGTSHLYFESRFESGNLRKAIQIGPREYDLILTPDVNSNSQHQWFYFEVSNMLADYSYTFNIVNCEKPNSQFNFGMKPIIFSVIEAINGRAGWVRTGMDICYYRNYCYRPKRGKNYFTISFTLTFPHAYDICYLAYHFPYTYSHLISSIWKWLHSVDHALIYFRADKLCHTLNGNENPLLTITAPDSYKNPIHKRKVIFLTSRVHPGESNASWIMHGTLEALLGNSTYVASLRNDYVFKIIPMLNIEGVINGCTRYGLTKEDLNRCWSNPKRYRHPSIYHTKGLLEYCTRILSLSPFIFVDYHGHSRKKNVFFIGCSNFDSWSTNDCTLPNELPQCLVLPYLMHKNSPAFNLPLCSFKVESHKESTARVSVWRQFGVTRSYTMESSFCGCDQGPLAGYHFNIKHLLDIGSDFCKALELLKYSRKIKNVYNFRSKKKYCCPLQCILKKSIKPPKCIQDRRAEQHILEIL